MEGAAKYDAMPLSTLQTMSGFKSRHRDSASDCASGCTGACGGPSEDATLTPFTGSKSRRASSLQAVPGSLQKSAGGDRFIPNRRRSDLDSAHFKVMNTPSQQTIKEREVPVFSPTSPNVRVVSSAYKRRLDFASDGQNEKKLLSFSMTKDDRPTSDPSFGSYDPSSALATPRKGTRYIPKMPDRILDMPGFRNDFYGNFVDWSSQNDIAVVLDTSVYSWNTMTKKCSEAPMFDEGERHTTVYSVAWNSSSRYLAVGIETGEIRIWDREKDRVMLLRTTGLCSHSSNPYTLTWSGPSEEYLFSGYACGCIIQCDIATSVAFGYFVHRGAVCAVQVSPDIRFMVSGGADCSVRVWNLREKKLHRSLPGHTDAVKAIAWCPWKPKLLATGSGARDGFIRLWNANNGEKLVEVSTRSQVCCMVWSGEHKELISGHGIQSTDIFIWKYPDLTPVAHLTGHTGRVLCLALGLDGKMLASCGADEKLLLWKCFDSYPASEKKKPSQPLPCASPFLKSIR